MNEVLGRALRGIELLPELRRGLELHALADVAQLSGLPHVAEPLQEAAEHQLHERRDDALRVLRKLAYRTGHAEAYAREAGNKVSAEVTAQVLRAHRLARTAVATMLQAEVG